jgi:hypothetical protein
VTEEAFGLLAYLACMVWSDGSRGVHDRRLLFAALTYLILEVVGLVEYEVTLVVWLSVTPQLALGSEHQDSVVHVVW